MFGIWRWILAISVLLGHVGYGQTERGSVPVGWYAVYSFFVLSGYLMTVVLKERYGFSANGLGRYGLNRALRLLPPYWIVLLLSAVLLHRGDFAGIPVNPPHQIMALPENALEWISGIFLFGQHCDEIAHRIVPVAWTLHVEALYYILIPLAARSRFGANLWLLASIGYAGYKFSVGETGDIYATTLGATLAFSAGSAIAWNADLLRPSARFAAVAAPLAIVLWLLISFYGILYIDPLGAGFLLTFGLTILIQICCAGLQTSNRWALQLDRALGNLSYPLYLIHYQVLLLLYPQSLKSLVLYLAIVHLLSALLFWTVERPIEAIRMRFKSRAAA